MNPSATRHVVVDDSEVPERTTGTPMNHHLVRPSLYVYGKARTGWPAPAERATGADTGTHWSTRAACRHGDPDLPFAEEGMQDQAAKAVCATCPVSRECLAHALDHRIPHGVWGGKSSPERRAILRRRAAVTT